MNGDVEGVAPRPRPLSGGLWTLFSWLRRDDHASSSESLSSVGSDRTAASFAFLAPAHYSVNKTTVFLPPPSPPTDSYRKRVQERNIRRQYERDLTLHRKYGLYRSEISNGYDAFSLPPTRKAEGDISSRWERERRATSECFQRRALHVPGKRRAPLPPVSNTARASVTHYKGPRKRRAPQPPIKLIEEEKETPMESNNISIFINPQTVRNDRSLQNSDTTTNTTEKSTKKASGSKDTKTRLDKGFLKHIFENRKRSSVIDTSAVKLLPNISELDKQAATIIENVKLEALKQSSNSDKQHEQNLLENSIKNPKSNNWFCVKCLRKYDSSVPDCPHCIFEKIQPPIGLQQANTSNDTSKASTTYTQTENGVVNQASRTNYNIEEKQKLKEMLKEMKDSLPKRPKHENKGHIISDKNNGPSMSTVVVKDIASETPTLRIGASATCDDKNFLLTKPSTSGLSKNFINSKVSTPLVSYNSVITSTPVVIHHDAIQSDSVNANKQNLKHKDSAENLPGQSGSKTIQVKENIILKNPPRLENMQKVETGLVGASSTNKNLQTPLRISSLLNPVYVPKKTDSKTTPAENIKHTDLKSVDKGNEIVSKPITQITTKLHNNPGIASTSTPSRTYCVTTNMVSALNNYESHNFTSITTKQDDSPVLSRESLSDVKNKKNITKMQNQVHNKNDVRPSTSIDKAVKDSNIKTVEHDGLNQHIKRRELINQLEKSIANGDEHAAAEAAIKLAQLRLSCSVLSFSSQIISEPSTSSVVPQKTVTSGLARIEATKNAPHKLESDRVKVTDDSDLRSKSNTVIIPIASSSQEKSLQQNEKKINQTTRIDKSVQSSSKNASDKIIPFGNNSHTVSQNVSPIEVLSVKEKESTGVAISVWVEDKEATRGPIKLNTHRQAVVGDLRRQAEAALGLPSHLQRWIVGRTLCTDDNTPLVTLAGSEFNAPFYLCLVETDPHLAGTSSQVETKTADIPNTDKESGNNVYKELVQLEQQALVPNAEVFECGVCIEECKPGSGIVLRECVHMFCKDCLADVVRHSEEPDISCPAMGCRGVLQEREIRGLVSPEDYERWLARGLTAAESGTRNAFHCRTKDCTGWALCDPGVRRFLCPVCKHSNCVPCQAIHEGETCDKHRAKLQAVSSLKSNQSDDSTRALLNNLINKGEALECPECKAIITKMWGCDWVKCSACKTEICWVTRGRRWGPGGRGDTSAGCRCGVDGKRCHPSCGYCH